MHVCYKISYETGSFKLRICKFISVSSCADPSILHDQKSINPIIVSKYEATSVAVELVPSPFEAHGSCPIVVQRDYICSLGI